MNLPEAEIRYLRTVMDRLRGVLGAALVGVYPSGSTALDAYRPGRSDLDLIVVATRPAAGQLGAIAESLRHDALPCPATGLELVLYDRETLAGLGVEAGFALNLNTGREIPAKVEFEAGDGPSFWYPIDRDVCAQQDRALTGPSWRDLTNRTPREALMPRVVESVAVHLEHLAGFGDNAVLNACRAARFHAERRWSAKPDAAAWMLRHHPRFEPLLSAAIASHRRDRTAGQGVPTGDAARFLTQVLDLLRG